METQRQERQAKRNEANPPFTFRFQTKKLKRGIERLATKHHRTIAGELNALCEAAVGGAK